MAKRKNNPSSSNVTAANIGYEARLWQMADALRGSMDAAEHKHVVPGLISLEYISDAFGEQHEKLEAERGHISKHRRSSQPSASARVSAKYQDSAPNE